MVTQFGLLWQRTEDEGSAEHHGHGEYDLDGGKPPDIGSVGARDLQRGFVYKNRCQLLLVLRIG
jgi:hypothetical protein